MHAHSPNSRGRACFAISAILSVLPACHRPVGGELDLQANQDLSGIEKFFAPLELGESPQGVAGALAGFHALTMFHQNKFRFGGTGTIFNGAQVTFVFDSEDRLACIRTTDMRIKLNGESIVGMRTARLRELCPSAQLYDYWGMPMFSLRLANRVYALTGTGPEYFEDLPGERIWGVEVRGCPPTHLLRATEEDDQAASQPAADD